MPQQIKTKNWKKILKLRLNNDLNKIKIIQLKGNHKTFKQTQKI